MKSAHPLTPLQLSLLSGVALISASSTANGTETKVPRQQPVTQDIKTVAPVVDQVKIPADPSTINVQTSSQEALPAKGSTLGARAVVPMQNRFAQPYYDVAADGSVWVRGATYKAQFGPSGATYIPFFGSAAPTNYPLAISVLEASVGGQPLAVNAAPAKLAGNRVDYARGAFIERYQVNTSSIEQQFVFDSLPLGGDLVMTVGFQTELEAQSTASGLQFGNALGHVSYGKATLIDAEGQRTEIPGQWLEGSLELRVAASDLASAAFPITIDPVVTTFAIDVTTLDDFYADVAYTAPSGVYCVAYEEVYSGTDHDVYAVTLDTAGNAVGGAYFDYTTNYWGDPSIASNLIADNFLVVAAVGLPTSGTRSIWGRHGSSTLVFGAQFQIDNNESGDKESPDVGGDFIPASPTYYLVVWQRHYSSTDTDIHGRIVEGNTTAVHPTIFLDNSSGTLDRYPSVSKCDGAAPYSSQNWHIVWQRDYTSTDHDIYGASVLWDGTVTQYTYLIDYSGLDDLLPQASSQLDGATGTRDALIVYTRGTGTARDIIGSVVNNAVVVSYANNISALGAFGGQDNIEPAVDSDGSCFAVVYSEQYSTSTTDYDIYVDTLSYSGGTLAGTELHQNLDFSSSPEHSPGISSTYSGGGAKVRYGTAWDRNHAAGLGDIYGGLYDGPCGAPPTPPTPYCFGDGTGAACPCGNFGAPGNGCAHSLNPSGANLSAAGTASIANDTLVLIGSGMPNSSALYYQGTSQVAAAFGDGIRCVGGSVVRLGTKQNVAGSSSYPTGADLPISIRGGNAAGDVRNYQCWYRNAAAYCTAATFNLTNGIQVTWAP